MVERVANWEPRLAAWLRASVARPHRYGRHDCMLFSAGVVKALTGHDFGRGHRGKYHGRKSSAAYLASLGFDSPAAMIGSLFDEVPVAFARRGDLVADEKGIPGVCIGGEAIFAGPHGHVRAPRRLWTKAWRV